MIPLNDYEIKVLSYYLKQGKGVASASEIAHSLRMGLFKVRRTLDSLEKKKLLLSSERSRTKPYILSEHGRAFAWLATLKNAQLVELYGKRQQLQL